MVVGKIELLELGELADRLGQRAQLVVGKIELPELGELADRLGQRAQLVVGKIELLELGELADRLGQRAQLVAGKIELLELGELADRLGQRAQLVGGRLSSWSWESWPIASGSVLSLRPDKFNTCLPFFRAFSMRWRAFPAGSLTRPLKRPLWHTF